MTWMDPSDRQLTLYAPLQAAMMALIFVGIGALGRVEVSLLDVTAVVELILFFFLNRLLYRYMRERVRRDVERQGGDRAENRGLRGIKRRLTGGPFFPNSYGVRLMALVVGLPPLGLGNVMWVSETLPERLRGTPSWRCAWRTWASSRPSSRSGCG